MPAIRQVKRSNYGAQQNIGGAFLPTSLLYPPLLPASSPLPLNVGNSSPLYPRSPSSSTSTDQDARVSVPRPSHARKQGPGHIPRPPNAFMLFRSDFCAHKKVTSAVERDHCEISKIVAHLWHGLDDTERKIYQERAREAKALHALRYPGYKYSPSSKKGKTQVKRRVKKDRVGKASDKRCKAVASFIARGLEGHELERAVERLDHPTFSLCDSTSAQDITIQSSPAFTVSSHQARDLVSPVASLTQPHAFSSSFTSSLQFVATEAIPQLDLYAPSHVETGPTGPTLPGPARTSDLHPSETPEIIPGSCFDIGDYDASPSSQSDYSLSPSNAHQWVSPQCDQPMPTSFAEDMLIRGIEEFCISPEVSQLFAPSSAVPLLRPSGTPLDFYAEPPQDIVNRYMALDYSPFELHCEATPPRSYSLLEQPSQIPYGIDDGFNMNEWVNIELE